MDGDTVVDWPLPQTRNALEAVLIVHRGLAAEIAWLRETGTKIPDMEAWTLEWLIEGLHLSDVQYFSSASNSPIDWGPLWWNLGSGAGIRSEPREEGSPWRTFWHGLHRLIWPWSHR